MKKFLAYLKGWRGIVLITYMWLILMAYVIVYVDVTSQEMRRRFYIVSTAEVILLVLVYICPKLLQWAEQFSITHHESLSADRKRRIFLKTWLISMSFFFVMYFIFYPGSLNPDNIGQFHQALSGRYNDAHPAFQTMFAYTLPLKLSGGWLASVYIFQIIFFSAVLAYTARVLYEYGGRRYTKWTLFYMLLNPFTYVMALTPLKDTSLAIAALLLMTFAVRIYFTKGEWLKNIFHTAVFMIVITAGTIFRHNALLFTVPLLFAVSLYVKKRHALLMFICFIAMIWGIRGPLYHSMGVSYPSNRQIESLSMPVRIMVNAVLEERESLDSEILDFVYSIAPLEIWQKYFDVSRGGYDKIKLLGKTAEEKEDAKLVDNQAIERTGWKKILTLTLRCFKEAPLPSITALLSPTTIAYGIIGAPVCITRIMHAENDLGLDEKTFLDLSFMYNAIRKIIPDTIEGISQRMENGKVSLQSVIVICSYAAVVLFKHLFWHIGVLNLFIIIFALARLRFDKAEGWRRLCLVLPMLMYVYDNNSTDGTADIALKAGAIVRHESRQGKGNVVRSMFHDIDAECYIMTDGDDEIFPYEGDMQEMTRLILSGEVDMIIGDRLSSTYFQENKRPFHNFGNSIVRKLINFIFGSNVQDIMTGFRVMNYHFVKSFPVVSKGFEIETEMTIHAIDKNMRIKNQAINFSARHDGSASKVNTFSDGAKVIKTILHLFCDYKPMYFFSMIAALLLLVSGVFFVPVLNEYLATSFVPRQPTLIACGFVALSALLSFFAGVILQTIKNNERREFEFRLKEVQEWYKNHLKTE